MKKVLYIYYYFPRIILHQMDIYIYISTIKNNIKACNGSIIIVTIIVYFHFRVFVGNKNMSLFEDKAKCIVNSDEINANST